MLALRDYGSSDENSEPENEKTNTDVETKSADGNDDFMSKPISVDKLTPPFNLQICSAPEVVPTVSIFSDFELRVELRDCFDVRCH